MKKALMVAAMLFAGIFSYCYGQDVTVIINGNEKEKSDYKIMGVSSSEDIGGVEAYFSAYANGDCVRFNNYNLFDVIVYCKVSYYDDINDVHEITFCKHLTSSTQGESYDFTRPREYYKHHNLEGMIVRKVTQ